MKRFLDRTTLQGIAILLGLGLVVGLASNLSAGSSRRLEWSRDWPDPGEPKCPETLPEPGDPASAAVSPGATAPEPVQAEPAAPSAAPAQASSPVEPVIPETGPASAPAPGSVANPSPSAPAVAASAPIPTAPAPASAPASPSSASADVPPVPPGKHWLELSPPQVDALFGIALFVDARMTTQYQEGHVQGAIPIPVWEADVDGKVAAVPFEVEGDMARPIVVYCNGGDCEDSHMLGQKLSEAGHLAVYVYKDGYPDWVRRGKPVSTGDAR